MGVDGKSLDVRTGGTSRQGEAPGIVASRRSPLDSVVRGQMRIVHAPLPFDGNIVASCLDAKSYFQWIQRNTFGQPSCLHGV
jgi:hypothetical protein